MNKSPDPIRDRIIDALRSDSLTVTDLAEIANAADEEAARRHREVRIGSRRGDPVCNVESLGDYLARAMRDFAIPQLRIEVLPPPSPLSLSHTELIDRIYAHSLAAYTARLPGVAAPESDDPQPIIVKGE